MESVSSTFTAPMSALAMVTVTVAVTVCAVLQLLVLNVSVVWADVRNRRAGVHGR